MSIGLDEEKLDQAIKEAANKVEVDGAETSLRRYIGDIEKALEQKTLDNGYLMKTTMKASYLKNYTDSDNCSSREISHVLRTLYHVSKITGKKLVENIDDETKGANRFELEPEILENIAEIRGEFTEYESVEVERKAAEYALASVQREDRYSPENLQDKVEDLLGYSINEETLRNRFRENDRVTGESGELKFTRT